MFIDLYYFSYTGTSKDIAESLSSLLKVTPKVIKTYKWPYFLWLITSFIPSLKVPITFEKPTSSNGILIFPKWTFNCPPVTTFLEKISFKKLFLIICYGGWSEKPYGEYYKRISIKRSGEVDIYFVKKNTWYENKTEELDKLIKAINSFFLEIRDICFNIENFSY